MGVPGDLDALAASGVVSAAGPGPDRRRTWPGRAPGSTTTSPSAPTSPTGSAARSSTGWSSRCSAASTPGTRTRSRCAPPSRSCCAAARGGGSLVAGRARAPGRRRRPNPAPVFQGIDGGIGRLPLAVADACRAAGVELRLRHARCARCAAPPHGWQVGTGERTAGRRRRGPRRARPRPPPGCWPPRPRPPRPSWPASSTPGMALVTLAFRRAELGELPRQRLPGPAGRRPRDQGLHLLQQQVGAGWPRPPRTPSCCAPRSAGTARSRTSTWDDAELVARSLRRPAARPPGSAPSRTRARSPAGGPACRSTRSGTSTGWTGSAKQVAELPAAWPCAGAAYEGVGIPACIASAWRAADPGAGGTRPGRDNERMTESS